MVTRGDKCGTRGPARSPSSSGAAMSEAAAAAAGLFRRTPSRWDPAATRLAAQLAPSRPVPTQNPGRIGRFGRPPVSDASSPRYAGAAGRARDALVPLSLAGSPALLAFPPGCPSLFSWAASLGWGADSPLRHHLIPPRQKWEGKCVEWEKLTLLVNLRNGR